MARSLDGATQAFLTAPIDLSAYNRLTLAFWLFKASYQVNDAILFEFSTNAATNEGAFQISADTSVSQFYAVIKGNVGFSEMSFTRPSAGAWHHYIFTFDMSFSFNEAMVATWVDGVMITPSVGTNANNTGNFGNYILGIGARNGVSQFAQGILAEVALFPGGSIFGDAQAAALAKGISPLALGMSPRPYYWPMIGRLSPEPELGYGYNAVLVGSPAAVSHVRVFYPAAGHTVSPGPMPAALEVLPPVIPNPFTVFAPSVSGEGAISPPVIASPFGVFAPVVSTDLGLAVPLIESSFTVYAPTVNPQEATIQEDSRELEPHNLKVRIVDFVGGDDLRITRLYTGLAGGITISKAYLTIKRHAKDDADAEAVVQKTITAAEQMSGQIQDNDTTGGSIQLYFDLSKDDTALLTPLIPYHYDVQVHTIGSAVYTCERGVIVMHQGVTHATS